MSRRVGLEAGFDFGFGFRKPGFSRLAFKQSKVVGFGLGFAFLK